jgi:hypothetical protein
MKWKALIVLLAIALSIVVPPSLPYLSNNGAMATIVTLDVCHAATPNMSSNIVMPCMGEYSCWHLPLAKSKNTGTDTPSFKPLLIAYLDERPPKV